MFFSKNSLNININVSKKKILILASVKSGWDSKMKNNEIILFDLIIEEHKYLKILHDIIVLSETAEKDAMHSGRKTLAANIKNTSRYHLKCQLCVGLPYVP